MNFRNLRSKETGREKKRRKIYKKVDNFGKGMCVCACVSIASSWVIGGAADWSA